MIGLAIENGFSVAGLDFSPIKGPEGNIEYLLHLKKHPEGTEVPVSLDVSVEDVVKEAHGQLD